MSTHTGSELVGLNDTVGADRDQPAVTNLQLTMELNHALVLPTVLGQKPPRLSTTIMGCCPCSSESFRRLAVWSASS
jgi:hypothetical protein